MNKENGIRIMKIISLAIIIGTFVLIALAMPVHACG